MGARLRATHEDGAAKGMAVGTLVARGSGTPRLDTLLVERRPVAREGLKAPKRIKGAEAHRVAWADRQDRWIVAVEKAIYDVFGRLDGEARHRILSSAGRRVICSVASPAVTYRREAEELGAGLPGRCRCK